MNNYVGFYRQNGDCFRIEPATNGFILSYSLVEVISQEDEYLETEHHDLRLLTASGEDVIKATGDWMALPLFDDARRQHMKEVSARGEE